jgi:hypothetical protein
MRTAVDPMPSDDAARVIDELAALLRRIEELEEAERAGDATAEAWLDRLYGRMDALAGRLATMQPRSLSEALAMLGIAAGVLGCLRHSEDDAEGSRNAKAHDLLTAVIRYLADLLPGADAASVAPILRRYAGIG